MILCGCIYVEKGNYLTIGFVLTVEILSRPLIGICRIEIVKNRGSGLTHTLLITKSSKRIIPDTN